MFFVVVLASIALTTSIPNLYYALYPMYGTFDVVLDDANVVIFTTPRSQAAGVKLGDRVAFEAMKPDDRYGGETGRFPPIGRRVTLLLERNGKIHTATLTSVYYRDRWIWALPVGLAKKTTSLVLILLASALFLLAPAALSRGLFLYVIGCTPTVAYFFSFLPMYAYYVVTIAVDFIWAAGAIGFLMIALALVAWRPSRWTMLIVPAAFAVVFGLAMIADTRTLLGGLSSASYYRAFDIARICCIALSTIILVVAFWRARMTAVRGVILILFVAGSLMILLLAEGYIPGTWLALRSQSARIAFKIATEGGWTANAIASFAVVFLIVRERVVDSGLIASRLLAYGSLSFAIVAALVALNWGFGTQLAGYAVVIPLEIVGAVLLGYWFSGLRDTANALYLAAKEAEVARIQGRFDDERDLLARALGLAQRTGQRGLIAEVCAHCAFSAWLSANDAAYQRHIDALSAVLGNRSMRGLGAYLSAAGGVQRTDSTQLPEWAARASLLLCGSADDALKVQAYARDALAYASIASSPWLRVLSLVALAESCPAERSCSLDEARVVARSYGWFAIDKSLAALRTDGPDVGVLRSFVDARLRKKRPARPPIEVCFFTGTVWAYGRPIAIHERELELLFNVATRRGGIRDDELLDRMWPDADGDAARNAFKVCLHRLRKSVRDSRVIARVGKRYELLQNAEVDLWHLQDAIAACGNDAEGAYTALRQYCTAFHKGAEDRAILGLWFAPFESHLQHLMSEAQRLLDLELLEHRLPRTIRSTPE